MMKMTTTISIDKRLLGLARNEAKEQKRSLSAQLEQWLEERFAARLTPTPKKKGGKAK
jgi:hypothetical protein